MNCGANEKRQQQQPARPEHRGIRTGDKFIVVSTLIGIFCSNFQCHHRTHIEWDSTGLSRVD